METHYDFSRNFEALFAKPCIVKKRGRKRNFYKFAQRCRLPIGDDRTRMEVYREFFEGRI